MLHISIFNLILVLTAKRGEDVTSRTVSYILNDPINDGGQWHMAVNLITKYGLMPKKCFPETFSCESSSRLNGILKSKLREFARNLRVSIREGFNKNIKEKMHVSIKSKSTWCPTKFHNVT